MPLKGVKHTAMTDEELGFQFSDGWLTGFKKRFGIKGHRTVGESGSVDQEDLESEIPKLRDAFDRYEWTTAHLMAQRKVSRISRTQKSCFFHRIWPPRPSLRCRNNQVVQGSIFAFTSCEKS